MSKVFFFFSFFLSCGGDDSSSSVSIFGAHHLLGSDVKIDCRRLGSIKKEKTTTTNCNLLLDQARTW